MSVAAVLPLALRDAYLALHRQTDAALARHGVTADQFVLLASLAHDGQALTQRELGRRMSSDPSTVRAMLVLLEKRGFIVRNSHPNDSRARTVSLTAQGKRTFRKLWMASESIRQQMLATLNAAEAGILIELLTRLAASLNKEGVSHTRLASSHSLEDER